jgi:hypothetical protein
LAWQLSFQNMNWRVRGDTNMQTRAWNFASCPVAELEPPISLMAERRIIVSCQHRLGGSSFFWLLIYSQLSYLASSLPSPHPCLRLTPPTHPTALAVNRFSRGGDESTQPSPASDIPVNLYTVPSCLHLCGPILMAHRDIIHTSLHKL